MASIYELTNEFRTLWGLMDQGAIDAEVLQDVFANTQEELAIKLEGYCKFIKNCESDIEGLKAEIKRLDDRKAVMENTIKRAKEAMRDAMIAAGGEPMTCGTFKLSVAKNTPKLVFDDTDVSAIPEAYLVPQAPAINKDAIKAVLKDGTDAEKKALVGIAHLEQGQHINIR